MRLCQRFDTTSGKQTKKPYTLRMQNASVIRKATVALSPLAKETSSMNVRQN